MIEITNVTKKLKKQVVLDDVSLKMEEGKCYGIVGHNGCGKTMLMRVICGFMSYDQGEIKVNGDVIGRDRDFIKDAGIIIGEASLIGGYTGFENLKVLAEIQGKIGEEEILETMELVGILEARDKKFKSYSLGMKQRLRLAQALMESPKILILDEAFNALDKDGIAKVQELLMAAKQEGRTMILTSHDDRHINMLCDKVFEMEKGRIVQEYEKARSC